MRISLTIILLLFNIIIFSQKKKYHFDKAVSISYQNIEKNESLKKSNFIFLINSKDNNFIEEVHFKKDSAYILLTDYNGIQIFQPKVDSISFIKAETVIFDCKSVVNHENPHKEYAKNFGYILHSDTIYNQKVCYHIEFKSNKSLKYQKRKKIKSFHMIIEKDENQIPFLYVRWDILINIWNTNKIPIKGKTLFAYNKNLEGKITFTNTFEYVDIDRYAIIPDDCDYIKKNKNPFE